VTCAFCLLGLLGVCLPADQQETASRVLIPFRTQNAGIHQTMGNVQQQAGSQPSSRKVKTRGSPSPHHVSTVCASLPCIKIFYNEIFNVISLEPRISWRAA
jgi:hypothetical protein